jgi:hypothetical protein
MVTASENILLADLTTWVRCEGNVNAAVLFGSQVRPQGHLASADRWSDIDLHVIAKRPSAVASIDWKKCLPRHRHCLQVLRPASGGVSKLTILFDSGEVDLVLIPNLSMHLANWGIRAGLHRRAGRLNQALNAVATIMSGGYRFLKGEPKWGILYRRIVSEMPGVRIDNAEAVRIANGFLCDLLWLCQKVQRGELIAARRCLNNSLIETNIVLLHEWRLRQGLPTFQQARRLEQMVAPDERQTVQVEASLQPNELQNAGKEALNGMCYLMSRLVPSWHVPESVRQMLART